MHRSATILLNLKSSEYVRAVVGIFYRLAVFKTAAYNKSKLLTNMAGWDYSACITARSVIRMAVLGRAVIGRKVLRNAAFLLSQCAHDLWAGWAGAARPPVRSSGTATCLVPPTRLASGGGSFNELKESVS